MNGRMRTCGSGNVSPNAECADAACRLVEQVHAGCVEADLARQRAGDERVATEDRNIRSGRRIRWLRSIGHVLPVMAVKDENNLADTIILSI